MSNNIIQEASLIGTICEQGPAGKDGKTPVRGVDYWTESDKTEIINEAMPHPDWAENDPTSKNYIQNRPGGYSNPPFSIEWDGDIQDKTILDVDFSTSIISNIKIVKVSDTVIQNKELLIGKSLTLKSMGKNPSVSIPDSVTIEESHFVIEKEEDIGFTILMYVLSDDDILPIFLSFDKQIPDTPFEDPGTYFMIGDLLGETFYVSSLPVAGASVKIPLDLIDASDLENVANNAKSQADSAMTTANNAKSQADSAMTTANNAKSQADSAMTTANNAKSKADSAMTTANSALQRANVLTDDYINNLIDTKLGVIENGTY